MCGIRCGKHTNWLRVCPVTVLLAEKLISTQRVGLTNLRDEGPVAVHLSCKSCRSNAVYVRHLLGQR